MSNCKECNQSLELVAGRRQKEFCSRKCRNAFHNRKLKGKGKGFKRVSKEKWEEIELELALMNILDKSFPKEEKGKMMACIMEGIPVISHHTADSVTILPPFSTEYWIQYSKFQENRTNPLINAARGRDESGVNEDENRTELEFSKSQHKKAKSKVLNSVTPKVDEILVSATIGNPVTVKLNAESCVIPPMPEKMIGEDSLDFAIRKNEWKKKYNK
jgi:hypothetical protein